MKSKRTLLEKYQSYSQNERRILQVISVIYQPKNISAIKPVLQKLGWKASDGALLSELLTSNTRNRWVKDGILVFYQNNIHCDKNIVEAITREAVKEQLFTEIIAVVQLMFPDPDPQNTPSFYIYSAEKELIRQRQIRNAFYLGDETTLMQRLGISDDIALHSLDYEKVRLLIQLCTLPFDPNFFKNLSEKLKVLVICPLLQNQAYELTNLQWFYETLEDIYPKAVTTFPSLKYVLAEQRLWRGRVNQAGKLLQDDDSSTALALTGWIKFQLGDNDGAISSFEAAIKRIKKDTRKRNVILPCIAELFYLFALMQRGDKKSYYEIHQQISLVQRATVTHRFLTITRKLQDLADIHSGEKHPQECYWLNDKSSLRPTPFNELFHYLILLWATGNTKPSQQLINYSQLAREYGWLWYAWVSAGIVQSQNPESLAEDFLDLTALFKPLEPWKIALKALREVNSPVDASETDNGAGMRMAWGIFYLNEQCMLFPREQKRNARGWTKGRPIALEKLCDHPELYTYLNDQDQHICQCIEMETVSNGYGYSSTQYHFSAGKALKAATGHPLLFWANETGSIIDQTPLELTVGEPVLEILQKNKRLLICISPWAAENNNVAFIKQGANKLKIVEFNLQQRQIAKILSEQGLTIPQSAKLEVLDSISAIAPLLTVHSDIGGTGAVDAKKVNADVRPVFHLEPTGSGLSLACYVQPLGENGPLFHPGLGAKNVFAEIDGENFQTQRSLKKETESFNEVINQCPFLMGPTDWEWRLEDPNDALETLMQLQDLADLVILTWPKGKKIQLSKPADISQMQISVRKQRNWFSLQGELQLTENDVIDMTKLLQLLSQSPGRFLRLGENQFLTLTQQLRKRLEDLHQYSDDLCFHPLAAQALEGLTGGMQVKQSKPWKEQLNKITSAHDLISQVPSTFQAQLRDYQHEGFQWLSRLAHLGAGACLADDMGLGKTIQALAAIVQRAPHGPTLVLAPSSVILNWQDEAQRFAPTLNVKRFGAGGRQQMLDQAAAFDLILCSYGLLQTEHERLAAVDWQTLIADEAQAIKNVHAKRSKAAMELNANFRIITTGTPIENHLGELWNLFQFINPGLLGSLDQFNKRFAVPIEVHNNRDAQRRLKNLIQPFILRRLKTDVLTELPARTEITIRVELSTEEIALYEALRRQAVERIAETDDHPGQKRIKMLTEIMRLRRACCHPRLVMPETTITASKLQAFAEIITEMQDNEHKALVFSQFVDHLQIIKAYLEKQNIVYQYLDGSTPMKQRKAAIDAFQSGIGGVFLISLKAGGVGLNLTAADYVIHMDPWWNPAVEDQASDRAHRMGQQRPVTIYRLVASNTIEEKIVKLHSQKRDLADNLLEGSEISGKMSVDEMLGLIEDNQ